MRVIAGSARSLPLKTPKGDATRPTTDRIKETLFNMLQPYIAGAIFIDCFSGSGGIGIEALSRGARHAYFIEKEKEPLSCIRDNLAFTHLADRATVLARDVSVSLYEISEKTADVIFMDPPYDEHLEEQVLRKLSEMHYVDEETLIVVEASLHTDFDYLDALGFGIMKEKRYKTNKHVFIRKRG